MIAPIGDDGRHSGRYRPGARSPPRWPRRPARRRERRRRGDRRLGGAVRRRDALVRRRRRRLRAGPDGRRRRARVQRQRRCAERRCSPWSASATGCPASVRLRWPCRRSSTPGRAARALRHGRLHRAARTGPSPRRRRLRLDDRLAGTTRQSRSSTEIGDQLASLLADGRSRPGERSSSPTWPSRSPRSPTEGRDVFYGGVLGKRIADHVADRGGALSLDDLAGHRGEWTEPVAVSTAARRVHNGLVSSGRAAAARRCASSSSCGPAGRPTTPWSSSTRWSGSSSCSSARSAPLLGDPRIRRDPRRARRRPCRADRRRPPRDRTPPGRRRRPAGDRHDVAGRRPDPTARPCASSIRCSTSSAAVSSSPAPASCSTIASPTCVVPRPGEPRRGQRAGPGQRPLHTLHGYVVE